MCLAPLSALSGLPAASAQWNGAGISVCEVLNQRIALLNARRGQLLALRNAFADRLGLVLPQDRRSSASRGATAASVGPGAYLIVSPAPAAMFTAERLNDELRQLAVVTDYTDQLTLLALSGTRCIEVMARLSAIDFESAEARVPLAIATRVGLLRAYLWRAGPDDPVMLAVQRSYAVSFWNALVAAAESTAAQRPVGARETQARAASVSILPMARVHKP